MPSTTTDIQPIADTLRVLGPQATAGLLRVAGPDALNDTLQALSEASFAELEQMLRALAPDHLTVFEALNPDGSVRDQAAFDRLTAETEQDL